MTIRDLIKQHEGYSAKVYDCPSGKKTIGWGHNLEVGTIPGTIKLYLDSHGEITEDMAEKPLTNDIAHAIIACQSLFKDFDEIDEVRRAAFLDFVFNVGQGTAAKFKKAIEAINERDWDRAALEMKNSLWFDQVKTRGVRIVMMIQKGEWI